MALIRLNYYTKRYSAFAIFLRPQL